MDLKQCGTEGTDSSHHKVLSNVLFYLCRVAQKTKVYHILYGVTANIAAFQSERGSSGFDSPYRNTFSPPPWAMFDDYSFLNSFFQPRSRWSGFIRIAKKEVLAHLYLT